jgi:glutamate formiminotransferase
MKVLAVPNWSFGRSNALLRQVRDLLDEADVETHFAEGDLDHNRTVTAFSGEHPAVESALFGLCELILPAINLNRHLGCHPRIGGLDVCPFVAFDSSDDLNPWVKGLAAQYAERWETPTFLYEKSSEKGRAAALPSLRKGGFGGLLARELDPDYGPGQAHPYLGGTVMGWRDFLIAMNINFKQPSGEAARTLAEKIRIRRKDDPVFKGVRAMGFTLPSKEESQLSMNLTRPNLTPIDPIVEWALAAGERAGVSASTLELIGVIRPRDMEHNTHLTVKPRQVVEMR